ncbi:MAG TPA: hypothetical protein VHU41_03660 [Thermoanaerobaculia bacterium]|nr:hypothetical protein [Thermoanaerobaculia bacterium]
MKENKARRAVALVNACIDAMRAAENAPDSPINRYTSVVERREMRRQAKRLRKGQLEPMYPNVNPAPQLADIYERTALRDDIFDAQRINFLTAQKELGKILDENDPEVRKALDDQIDQMKREAQEGGPGSEAAQRLRCLQLLAEGGAQWHDEKRRQKDPPKMHIAPRLTSDPLAQARMEAAAAEILTAVPEGEQVWTFPSEASGARPLLLRIGIPPVSWVASFERGNKGPSTVQLMPGDTHFFVSAAGAGYIIEALTRTLVERVGNDVVAVGFDESRTIFFVNHDDRILEAYGPHGVRLWKIALGVGFRGLTLNGASIAGEAQRSPDAEWSGFTVDVGTGEVRWG